MALKDEFYNKKFNCFSSSEDPKLFKGVGNKKEFTRKENENVEAVRFETIEKWRRLMEKFEVSRLQLRLGNPRHQLFQEEIKSLLERYGIRDCYPL